MLTLRWSFVSRFKIHLLLWSWDKLSSLRIPERICRLCIVMENWRRRMGELYLINVNLLFTRVWYINLLFIALNRLYLLPLACYQSYSRLLFIFTIFSFWLLLRDNLFWLSCILALDTFLNASEVWWAIKVYCLFLLSFDILETTFFNYLRKSLTFLLAFLGFMTFDSFHLFLSFLILHIEHDRNDCAVCKEINENLSVLVYELQYKPIMCLYHLSIVFAVIPVHDSGKLRVCKSKEAKATIWVHDNALAKTLPSHEFLVRSDTDFVHDTE